MVTEAHSAKWHSCVDQVSAQGGVDSPEAVCTAVLGPESFELLEIKQLVLDMQNVMSLEDWKTAPKKTTEEELKEVIKEIRGAK